MRHHNSIFNELLKPMERRVFDAIVGRHDGDRYVKAMSTWTQLTAMIFAQLSPAGSLRAVAAGWNANAHFHYHLGAGHVCRSTLADANRLRSPQIFADAFAHLSGLCDRQFRREGGDVVRLIDSSPIPAPFRSMNCANGPSGTAARRASNCMSYSIPRPTIPGWPRSRRPTSTMSVLAATVRLNRVRRMYSTRPMPIMRGGRACTRQAAGLSLDPRTMSVLM